MEKYNKLKDLILKELNEELEFLQITDIEPKRAHFQQLKWTVSALADIFNFAFDDESFIDFKALALKVEKVKARRFD